MIYERRARNLTVCSGLLVENAIVVELKSVELVLAVGRPLLRREAVQGGRHVPA